MWKLQFIKEEDFFTHVEQTIIKYGEKLNSVNLEGFNKNIIEPVKLIFDKTVCGLDWKEVVNNELARQRDKSNNNEIGYFYQNIFKYINNCSVPDEGWDVIYMNEEGIDICENINVKEIFVEMKNKHNTMNSTSASKTMIKMQSTILNNEHCACFLVEAIAKKSQNIVWLTTVDKVKVSHNLIRRVSLDEFYYIVTGEKDAFYQICMVLPNVIKKVVDNLTSININIPEDTVIDDLYKLSEDQYGNSEDFSIMMAIYMLGFGSYNGFR